MFHRICLTTFAASNLLLSAVYGVKANLDDANNPHQSQVESATPDHGSAVPAIFDIQALDGDRDGSVSFLLSNTPDARCLQMCPGVQIADQKGYPPSDSHWTGMVGLDQDTFLFPQFTNGMNPLSMRTIIEGAGAPDFEENPVDHFTLPIAYAELCPAQEIKIFSDPAVFVAHVLGQKAQWQALEGEDCGVSNFDHLFQANIENETLEIMAHTAYIKITVEKDPVHFSVDGSNASVKRMRFAYDLSNEAAQALSVSNGVKGHSAIIRSMVVDLITAPKDDNPLSSVVPMKKAVALRFYPTVGLDWLFSQGFKGAQVTFSN